MLKVVKNPSDQLRTMLNSYFDFTNVVVSKL